MRYIADSNGYIKEISFGAAIECGGQTCTEYTGSVPSGYSSLEDWFTNECETLYRWKITSGNLTLVSSETEPKHVYPDRMTLLWTNTSPTATFAAKSVDIAGGGYDCYKVVAHISNNLDVRTYVPPVISYKGEAGFLQGLPNNKIARRKFTINAAGTSVTFDATEYCKSTYGTAATENDYLVPMYIYGMYLNK